MERPQPMHGPRRMTEGELKRCGIEMPGFPHLTIATCLTCGQSWSPPIQPGGRWRRGWWKCLNECNVMSKWDRLAWKLAKEAHEGKRGTGGERLDGVFCYTTAEPQGQEKELAELRQWMKEQRIIELGFASYRHSFTMIVLQSDEERFCSKVLAAA